MELHAVTAFDTQEMSLQYSMDKDQVGSKAHLSL
jgi:hypothetical protein